jgi:hypothetical protein
VNLGLTVLVPLPDLTRKSAAIAHIDCGCVEVHDLWTLGRI